MKRVSKRNPQAHTAEPISAAPDELRDSSKKSAKRKAPDMTRFWTKFPQISADSGGFLEEDR